MPIVGLTDSKEPRFVRFGKIRKGAERPESGDRPGRDLDHFRVTFEPEWQHLQEPFKQAFPHSQQKPLRSIPIMLMGKEKDDCFTVWYESWTATALQNRCDGHTKSVSLVKGRYMHGLGCTKGAEAVGHDDSTFACKCQMIGRLSVGIPAVWDFPGVNTPGIFVMETHSIHDVIRLSQRLNTIHAMYGSLLKLPMTLSRKLEKISHYQDGQRKLRQSWLLHITEHIDSFHMLGSGQPDKGLPAPRVYNEVPPRIEKSPAPGQLPSTTKPSTSARSQEEHAWDNQPPARPPEPAFPPPFDTGDFLAIVKIIRNVRYDVNDRGPEYYLYDGHDQVPIYPSELTPLAKMFGKSRDDMADWVGDNLPLEYPLYVKARRDESFHTTQVGEWQMTVDQIATLQNPAIAYLFSNDFRRVIKLSGFSDKAGALQEMLGVDKITDSTLTIGEAIAKADEWLSQNKADRQEVDNPLDRIPE